MRKVLVIVHLEPCFRNSGTEEILADVINAVDDYYEVINVTCGNIIGNGEQYEELLPYRQEEWLYGFYLDSDERYVEGDDYISVSTPHQYAFIDPWIKQLPNSGVTYYLVGGARWECLQDVYEIFQHLKLECEVIHELTYAR